MKELIPMAQTGPTGREIRPTSDVGQDWVLVRRWDAPARRYARRATGADGTPLMLEVGVTHAGGVLWTAFEVVQMGMVRQCQAGALSVADGKRQADQWAAGADMETP